MDFMLLWILSLFDRVGFDVVVKVVIQHVIRIVSLFPKDEFYCSGAVVIIDGVTIGQ